MKVEHYKAVKTNCLCKMFASIQKVAIYGSQILIYMVKKKSRKWSSWGKSRMRTNHCLSLSRHSQVRGAKSLLLANTATIDNSKVEFS